MSRYTCNAYFACSLSHAKAVLAHAFIWREARHRAENLHDLPIGRKGIMTMKDNNNANINENKENKTPTITTKIGSTTYVVGLHFSKTSKETLQDKIKRMVLEDAKKENH